MAPAPLGCGNRQAAGRRPAQARSSGGCIDRIRLPLETVVATAFGAEIAEKFGIHPTGEPQFVGNPRWSPGFSLRSPRPVRFSGCSIRPNRLTTRSVPPPCRRPRHARGKKNRNPRAAVFRGGEKRIRASVPACSCRSPTRRSGTRGSGRRGTWRSPRRSSSRPGSSARGRRRAPSLRGRPHP